MRCLLAITILCVSVLLSCRHVPERRYPLWGSEPTSDQGHDFLFDVQLVELAPGSPLVPAVENLAGEPRSRNVQDEFWQACCGGRRDEADSVETVRIENGLANALVACWNQNPEACLLGRWQWPINSKQYTRMQFFVSPSTCLRIRLAASVWNETEILLEVDMWDPAFHPDAEQDPFRVRPLAVIRFDEILVAAVYIPEPLRSFSDLHGSAGVVLLLIPVGHAQRAE